MIGHIAGSFSGVAPNRAGRGQRGAKTPRSPLQSAKSDGCIAAEFGRTQRHTVCGARRRHTGGKVRYRRLVGLGWRLVAHGDGLFGHARAARNVVHAGGAVAELDENAFRGIEKKLPAFRLRDLTRPSTPCPKRAAVGSRHLRFGIVILIGAQENRLVAHQSKVSDKSMLSIRYRFAKSSL